MPENLGKEENSIGKVGDEHKELVGVQSSTWK